MNTATIPPESIPNLQRLTTDFEFFAARCLWIRTKSGEIVPFRLNRSQRYLHRKIEEQRAKTGRVRKIIVKGRQGGSSTYIEGRYFWRNWRTTRALRAYILTHHDDATANLFGMAELFYARLPNEIKPKTKAANAKELVFADSGAGYKVATAGTKEVGRSDTIQLFHGSEMPSWPNADAHVSGVMQAIANAPDSESILESTAKGVGNTFYTMAMAAARGDSDYEIIFVPWFWSEDYETPCPRDHHFSDEWLQYGTMHKLEWPQLYWAWLKNRELCQAKSLSPDKICADFRQEYPATFDEAFQTSGDSFIPAMSVMQAKANAKLIGPEKFTGRGPLIIGIDPAPYRDKLGIIDRRGIVLGQTICERWEPNPDVEYVGAKLAALFRKLQPDAVNIDTSEGFGAALYNWLANHGWSRCVNAINFGSAPLGIGPTGDELYANRRAEMWDIMRAWFETPGGVAMVDDEALTLDILSPQWGPGQTRRSPTNHELIMEPKDKIRERLGASPDLGDAAALCFSVDFGAAMEVNNQPRPKRRTGKAGY